MNDSLFLLALIALETTLVAAAAIIFAKLARHHAALRYGFCLAALCVLVGAVPVTFALQRSGVQTIAIRQVQHVMAEPPVPDGLSEELPAPEPSRNPDPLQIAMIVWAAGAGIALIRLAFGARQVSHLRKRGETWKRAHLTGNTPVLISAEIGTPVVVGLLKPVVLLPRHLLESLDEEELADVLAHEFAHISYRHLVVGLLQRLATAVFWPHPLIHFLNRELIRAREEICDNFALRCSNPARYARVLLAVAESSRRGRCVTNGIGLFGQKQRLEERVQSLLDPQRRLQTQMNRKQLFFIAFSFCMACSAIAGARLQTLVIVDDGKQDNTKALEPGKEYIVDAKGNIVNTSDQKQDIVFTVTSDQGSKAKYITTKDGHAYTVYVTQAKAKGKHKKGKKGQTITIYTVDQSVHVVGPNGKKIRYQPLKVDSGRVIVLPQKSGDGQKLKTDIKLDLETGIKDVLTEPKLEIKSDDFKPVVIKPGDVKSEVTLDGSKVNVKVDNVHTEPLQIKSQVQLQKGDALIINDSPRMNYTIDQSGKRVLLQPLKIRYINSKPLELTYKTTTDVQPLVYQVDNKPLSLEYRLNAKPLTVRYQSGVTFQPVKRYLATDQKHGYVVWTTTKPVHKSAKHKSKVKPKAHKH